jgi:hypothetical protein
MLALVPGEVAYATVKAINKAGLHSGQFRYILVDTCLVILMIRNLAVCLDIIIFNLGYYTCYSSSQTKSCDTDIQFWTMCKFQMVTADYCQLGHVPPLGISGTFSILGTFLHSMAIKLKFLFNPFVLHRLERTTKPILTSHDGRRMVCAGFEPASTRILVQHSTSPLTFAILSRFGIFSSRLTVLL